MIFRLLATNIAIIIKEEYKVLPFLMFLNGMNGKGVRLRRRCSGRSSIKDISRRPEGGRP